MANPAMISKIQIGILFSGAAPPVSGKPAMTRAGVPVDGAVGTEVFTRVVPVWVGAGVSVGIDVFAGTGVSVDLGVSVDRGVSVGIDVFVGIGVCVGVHVGVSVRPTGWINVGVGVGV
jgi:hypothetical protein